MPKAKALGNTFLKAAPLPSSDLRDKEKIYVPEGHEFYIYRYAPDRNQHVFTELANSMRQFRIVDFRFYGPTGFFSSRLAWCCHLV